MYVCVPIRLLTLPYSPYGMTANFPKDASSPEKGKRVFSAPSYCPNKKQKMATSQGAATAKVLFRSTTNPPSPSTTKGAATAKPPSLSTTKAATMSTALASENREVATSLAGSGRSSSDSSRSDDDGKPEAKPRATSDDALSCPVRHGNKNMADSEQDDSSTEDKNTEEADHGLLLVNNCNEDSEDAEVEKDTSADKQITSRLDDDEKSEKMDMQEADGWSPIDDDNDNNDNEDNKNNDENNNKAAEFGDMLKKGPDSKNPGVIYREGYHQRVMNMNIVMNDAIRRSMSLIPCAGPPIPPPRALLYSDGSRRIPGDYSSPKEKFPMKLHYMLLEEEKTGGNIISYIHNGRAFIIHDSYKFVKHVSPRYFRNKKFSEFTLQLKYYGFQWVNPRRERDGYYHELFRKDNPELCLDMSRLSYQQVQLIDHQTLGHWGAYRHHMISFAANSKQLINMPLIGKSIVTRGIVFEDKNLVLTNNEDSSEKILEPMEIDEPVQQLKP